VRGDLDTFAPRRSLIPRFRSAGARFFLSISHGVHARCTRRLNAMQDKTKAWPIRRASRISQFHKAPRYRSCSLARRLFTFASIVRRRPFGPRFRDLNPFLRGWAHHGRPISRRVSTSLANEPDDRSYFSRNCPPADWTDDIQPRCCRRAPSKTPRNRIDAVRPPGGREN